MGSIDFDQITSIQDMKSVQLMEQIFEAPWIDTILWAAQVEAVGFGGTSASFANKFDQQIEAVFDTTSSNILIP